MLARANRIVRADDYRNTVRRGRKSATAHCVVYVRSGRPAPQGPAVSAPGDIAQEPRFGFIVSKAVGNAVTRNTVRRRLKAVSHELLRTGVAAEFLPERTDVVIRALPGSIGVPWSTLLEEIDGVVRSIMPANSRGVVDKGVK
ncbi:ribonuclease P protein component [Frondihabitans australicus]|uniref:Ribonuclease P protein component n=1 Tax=Frondihabitans australicus TaxID=386892 RepID=A0A495IJ73_9MICO|nr:ribonuclease P protein component [Frondihabitans australicus]RKR75829.1 ribonuclease P protein component [Frondihabitans australicus]